MGIKKWLVWFGGTCLILALLFGLWNVLIDPFGVFGDPLFNWYAYDMTQNPRAAKLAYLERHNGEYDSYVIGSSKVSSISCAELNDYLGASFYNMTWYGGKLGDELDAANYLLDHYAVRNMVLMVEPQNTLDYRTVSRDLKERMHCKADGSSAVGFYFSYLFCNPRYGTDKLTAWARRGYLVNEDAVYTPETGSYNKQRRDIEPIGGLAAYLEKNGGNFPVQQPVTDMPFVDACLDAVGALKTRCEEKGVNLIVMTAPQYADDFLSFDREQLSRFWRGLADITDFWDFSGRSSVGDDPRYFYDVRHFRNCVGTMALARVFDNDGVFVPADFGVHVTAETVETRLDAMWEEPAETVNSVSVPIFMYHSLTEDESQVNSVTMTLERFTEQMQAIAGAGYQTVTYGDLTAWVERGVPLPEKPVLLTFDDGYANNLTLAAPVLERFGYNAAIAVVGCSAGKDTYKDTGEPMTPHFSIEEAEPWVEKGVIQLVSHSWDLHQVPERDGEPCREGARMLPGETEEQFETVLREDAERFAALVPAGTGQPFVFTYPYGVYSEFTEAVLRELGTDVSVTTEPGRAEIVRGLPQSLLLLPRFEIRQDTTSEQLLELLD